MYPAENLGSYCLNQEFCFQEFVNPNLGKKYLGHPPAVWNDFNLQGYYLRILKSWDLQGVWKNNLVKNRKNRRYSELPDLRED